MRNTMIQHQVGGSTCLDNPIGSLIQEQGVKLSPSYWSYCIGKPVLAAGVPSIHADKKRMSVQVPKKNTGGYNIALIMLRFFFAWKRVAKLQEA